MWLWTGQTLCPGRTKLSGSSGPTAMTNVELSAMYRRSLSRCLGSASCFVLLLVPWLIAAPHVDCAYLGNPACSAASTTTQLGYTVSIDHTTMTGSSYALAIMQGQAIRGVWAHLHLCTSVCVPWWQTWAPVYSHDKAGSPSQPPVSHGHASCAIIVVVQPNHSQPHK